MSGLNTHLVLFSKSVLDLVSKWFVYNQKGNTRAPNCEAGHFGNSLITIPEFNTHLVLKFQMWYTQLGYFCKQKSH